MSNTTILIQPEHQTVIADLTQRGISFLIVGEYALYPYLIQNSVPSLQLWVDPHSNQFQRFKQEGTQNYMDAVYGGEDVDRMDIRINNSLTRLHRHIPGFTTDDFAGAFSRQQQMWLLSGPQQKAQRAATLGFPDLVEHLLQFPRSPLSDRLKQEFRDFLGKDELGKTLEGKTFLTYTPHQPQHMLSARERINQHLSPAVLLEAKGYTSLPEFENESTAFRVYSKLHTQNPQLALTQEDSTYILYKKEPKGITNPETDCPNAYINLRYVQDKGDTYDLLRKLENEPRNQDKLAASLLASQTGVARQMPTLALPAYYNRNPAVLRTMIWNKHYEFKAVKHAISANNYPIFWGRVQVAKTIQPHTIFFPQTNSEDTVVGQINGQEPITTPRDAPDALWTSNPPVALKKSVLDTNQQPLQEDTEGHLFTYQGRQIFVTGNPDKPGQVRQAIVQTSDLKEIRLQRIVILNHPQQALYFHENTTLGQKDGVPERRMYIAIPDEPTQEQKARLEKIWENNRAAEIVLGVENTPESQRMALNVLTFPHPNQTSTIHTELDLQEPQEDDPTIRLLTIRSREPLPQKALGQLEANLSLDYPSRADRFFDTIKINAGLIPNYERRQDELPAKPDQPPQGLTTLEVKMPNEPALISKLFYEAARERNWQAGLSIFQIKTPAFGDETFSRTFEKKNRQIPAGPPVFAEGTGDAPTGSAGGSGPSGNTLSVSPKVVVNDPPPPSDEAGKRKTRPSRNLS